MGSWTHSLDCPHMAISYCLCPYKESFLTLAKTFALHLHVGHGDPGPSHLVFPQGCNFPPVVWA